MKRSTMMLTLGAVGAALILVAVGTGLGRSEETPPTVPLGAQDLGRLANLCTELAGRNPAPPSSGVDYVFEQSVSDAAGIVLGDDPSDRKRKIQRLWRDHQPRFRCAIEGSPGRKVGILEYALDIKQLTFLRIAVEEWEVDLNIPDPASGETLLDHVRRAIDSDPQGEFAGAWREFFETLRKRGAKRSAELRG